jgi:hypothetical protein
MTPTVHSRRALWSLLAASVVAVLAALYHVRTYDTFFHLAAGRYIVEHGSVPTTDPFSFTHRGAPWLNHSWGFQVALATLQRALGFAGVSWWQACSAVLLVWIAWSALPRRPELRVIGAAVAVVPIVALREVLEARPHVVGFLGLAFGLRVVLASAHASERSPRLPWLLVPVYAAWATAHGSHVLMFAILACGLLCAVLAGDKRAGGAWAGALLACVALLAWLAPHALTQGGQHVASSFLEGSVAEWYPLTAADLVWQWPGRLLVVCAVVALWQACTRDAAAALELGPRSRWAIVLLLLTFTGLAFTSRRMLALYLLAALPLWLPFVTVALARVRVLATHPLAVALPLLLLVPVLTQQDQFETGAGLMQSRVPREAVAFLHTRPHVERVYNAYNFGGYLMWERYPAQGVFVDGRAITVYPASFMERFEQAYRAPQVFEQLASEYRVDAVLLPAQSTRVAPLLAHLASSDRWRRSHVDAVAVVYERVTTRTP